MSFRPAWMPSESRFHPPSRSSQSFLQSFLKQLYCDTSWKLGKKPGRLPCGPLYIGIISPFPVPTVAIPPPPTSGRGLRILKSCSWQHINASIKRFVSILKKSLPCCKGENGLHGEMQGNLSSASSVSPVLQHWGFYRKFCGVEKVNVYSPPPFLGQNLV